MGQRKPLYTPPFPVYREEIWHREEGLWEQFGKLCHFATFGRVFKPIRESRKIANIKSSEASSKIYEETCPHETRLNGS